jgi:DNA-binding Lrp family transcriptional regulator
MPFQLDDYDVAILKALMKDGRKSFREISRETGITTPTVKARFERLINVGFVKSVSPIFDFGAIQEDIMKLELRRDESMNNKSADNEVKNKKNKQENLQLYRHQNLQQSHRPIFKIKKGMKIKLDCEFCEGPITGHLHVFRFANYERFFCCTGCMSGYKQKHAGRIESIKRRFEGKE